jgi:hypothetical protein
MSRLTLRPMIASIRSIVSFMRLGSTYYIILRLLDPARRVTRRALLPEFADTAVTDTALAAVV